MTTSPTIAALAAALAKAQGQIKGAIKDSDNPFFKSKYADLASVWDACRGPLSANGLSVVQMPGDCLIVDSGAVVTLTTRLLHETGEWIEETMTIPVSKPDAQGCGSALTYARRYALSAFVGVAPEDDDGESAMARTQAPQEPRKVQTLPASRPKAVPVPGAKLDALKRQAKAILSQLALVQLVDVLCIKDTPEGSIALKSTRVKHMGPGPFDASSEADMERWVDVLTRFRDQNMPPHDLMA